MTRRPHDAFFAQTLPTIDNARGEPALRLPAEATALVDRAALRVPADPRHDRAVTAIRARVQGGRLLVDQPTDLPEGLEVSLAIVDDDLTDDERTALEASIEESYAQMDRGELHDAREVLASLRSPSK